MIDLFFIYRFGVGEVGCICGGDEIFFFLVNLVRVRYCLFNI